MTEENLENKDQDDKTRNRIDEFYKIAGNIDGIRTSEASCDLDLFLDRVAAPDLPPGDIDVTGMFKVFLFNIMEYAGATEGCLYSVGINKIVEPLCDLGARKELDINSSKVIYPLFKEVLEENRCIRRKVGSTDFLLSPVLTGVGGAGYLLLLTGLSDQSEKTLKRLLQSSEFRIACKFVRERVLFAELLKDADYGLLCGDTFFRTAELNFNQAKCDGSPMAIGALVIKRREIPGEIAEARSEESIEKVVTQIKYALEREDLLSFHDPELFMILMPSQQQKAIEEKHKRLKRAFEGDPCRDILFGVSLYDGRTEADFSELLMTLSETLDICLDGRANFTIKNVNIEASSKFMFSERASELLFQLLDHRRLMTLFKINQVFGRVYELNRLFDSILDLALSAIRAERGLFCVQDNDEELKIVAARNTEGAIKGELNSISRSIIAEVMKNRRPIFSRQVETDKHLRGRESIIGYGIRSVLCMPLVRKNDLYGVIYLDVRGGKRELGLSDLIFLKAISNQAVMAIENASLHERKEGEIKRLRIEMSGGIPSFIGQSAVIRDIIKKVRTIRDSDITVLLEGGSGSGKEILAKTIHAMSWRNDKPFLTIDCSSISDNLIESELFGHARGAFTDAKTERMGLFEAGTGGTVFLDEVDSLKKPVQGKLLRAIEEGEVRRLGENHYRKVDVRVITSTKIDLREAVERGDFREDLYYRLRVFKIDIPPLRSRKEDIPLLIDHFLNEFSSRYDRPVKGLSQDAVEYLLGYSWPGNVRELRNTIERGVVSSTDGIIRRDDLSLDLERTRIPVIGGGTYKEKLDCFQRQVICETLAENRGNITTSARALGLSRRGLQKQIQRHGIRKEEFKSSSNRPIES